MSSSRTIPARGTTAASGAGGVRELPHLAGFWIVAAAYLVLAAFGTAPTPLWPAYEQADGFGALTVTVAFAIMVIGVAASLAVLGHLSDRLGRRRLVVPALGVGVGAAIVFTASSSLAALLVGRLLTGVAIGLIAATATAYLSDLYGQARPDATSDVAGVVAGVAGLGGLALGPLLTGTIAPLTARPLTVPYAVYALLMLALLGLALVTPETVDIDAQLEQPPRFVLRPGNRGRFVFASTVGFCAFAVSGLFSSLGAIIIRRQLGLTSLFVGGTGTMTVFAASAVSQIVLRKLAPRPMMIIGAALFPIGLALTVGALLYPALWLFLTAAAVAGAGAGLLFKAGLTTSAATASPTSRAGVLAVFFIISYIGLGLPSILFALVLQTAPLVVTMTWFASVLAAATLICVALATHRPSAPGNPSTTNL